MSSAATNARLLAAIQDDVPDPEVRHIEREADAVEREAFALELEAGRALIGEPTLQELLTAAQIMAEAEDNDRPFAAVTWHELLTATRITRDLCEALQEQPLEDDQKRLLAELCPGIADCHNKIEKQIASTRRSARKRARKPRPA